MMIIYKTIILTESIKEGLSLSCSIDNQVSVRVIH